MEVKLTPPKFFFSPSIAGVRGSGAPLISPPSSHFIGGSESLQILGVPGILALKDRTNICVMDVHTYGQRLKATCRPAPPGSGNNFTRCFILHTLESHRYERAECCPYAGFFYSLSEMEVGIFL